MEHGHLPMELAHHSRSHRDLSARTAYRLHDTPRENGHSRGRQLYTRDRLLKYCYLDTYAMVKIHKKLKEVIK